MRYISLLLGILLIAAVLVIQGCGDDDDDVTAPVTPAAYIDGTIYMNQMCVSDLYIFGRGGLNPYLDSVKIGDSLCYIDSSYWHCLGDPYYYVNFSDDAAPQMYEVGDVASIVFYGRGRASTASVKLLDYANDEIYFVSPDYGEVVPQGVPIQFVWHQVDNAEWYGIYYEYSFESGSGSVYHKEYAYAYDTTYTFAGDLFNSQLDYVSILVIPCAGPNPAGTSGNITGDYAMGRILSYGNGSERSVYGEGDRKDFTSPDIDPPVVTAREIISKLFEK